MLAEVAALAATQVARDIHLSRWLCEGEVRRAKAYLRFRSKHLAGEVEKCLLQVGKRHVFVDIESFHLVEEAVCTIGNCLIAIHAAGAHNADWWLCVLHHAALHR